MPALLNHCPKIVLGIWFAMLAIAAFALMPVGPPSTQVALVDRSAGQFITFGSIYMLLTIFAVIGSFLILQWRINGLQAIFEFNSSSESSSSESEDVWKRFVQIGIYTAIVLAGLYFMFVSLGGTLISTMEHDSFVFFDGVQHLASGRRQHIDFHTPMGQLCNLIPYWGYIVSGRFAGSMEWGCLLAGIYLMTIGAYVLSSRYTIGLAIPVVMFFCLLAVVPMGIDGPPQMITTAMFYNRLCWAALTLMLLFYVEPRQDVSRNLWLDSAMLSGLLLFLFYLKISYALVAVAFIGLLFFDSPYNRRLVLATLGISAAIVVALEAAFGFHRAYLKDIRDTLQASGANRGSMVPKLFANIREFLMATFAVVLSYSCVPKKWNYLIYMGFVFASGLAIIDQNTHYRGVISLIAVFAVAQEFSRRKLEYEPLSSANSQSDLEKIVAFRSLACLGLLLAFVIQPITYGWTATTIIRSAVVLDHQELPQGLSGVVFSCYKNPILEGDKHGKVQRTSDFAEMKIGQEYINSVLDGVKLLEASGTSGKSVMTFDFANPFSFILGLKPAIGDTTCVHYGRTMNDGITPSPEEYLGQVDYVMVPLKPRTPATADFLWKTYKPYIEKKFDKAVANDYWTLWKRKSRQSSMTHESATRQTALGTEAK